MAKSAVIRGIHTIIATPHFITGETEYTIDALYQKVDALNSALIQGEIPLTIMPGQEIYLLPEIPKLLKNKEVITVGDKGRYLLVELPMNDYPAYAENTLFEILLQGVVPVIAHPERNKVIAKHPSVLYKLVTKGVLAQANVGSFHGLYGSKAQEAVELFCKQNLIHFLGYDAHAKDIYDYEIPSKFDYLPAENAFHADKYLATQPVEILKKKKFWGLF